MIIFDNFVQFNIIFGCEDLPTSSLCHGWKSYQLLLLLMEL